MFRTTFSGIATVTMAATLIVAVPITVLTAAPARADPVPTVDEVLAVLAGLTDPGIPAASKTNIVTPGFAPDEAGTIDDHLNRMNARGRILPLPFIVTDIQPAPNNFAGATLATGGSPRQSTNGSAMAEMDVFWREATRFRDPGYQVSNHE